MKNLIKAVTTENRKRLEDFIFSINQLTSKEELNHWQYSDLIPRGKDITKMSFDALKSYLIGRKEKAVNKSIEREVNKIKAVTNAGELIDIKVSVEWKANRTWGSNPKAEAWITSKNVNGAIEYNYVKSESIGGCGYDKLSTSVAQCLNQFKEVLKPLYAKKDKNVSEKNNDLLGYGSGYGILPSIEGGVGVSCYNRIFEGIGYKFQSIASGKSFDVFTISKL